MSGSRGYTETDDPQRKTRTNLNSLEQARRIAALAQEKLAEDVVILDMRPVCTFTDYFVICSGRNPRQTADQLAAVDVEAEGAGREVLQRTGGRRRPVAAEDEA